MKSSVAIVAGGAAAVVAAGAAGCLMVLPSLPRPTGPHPVVAHAITLSIEGLDQPLALEVWYPAVAGSIRGKASYLPSDQTPDDPPGFSLTSLTRTHAAASGRPAISRTSPGHAIFYEQGLGGNRMENFALCNELASHGLFVISIDYNAPPVFSLIGEVSPDFSSPEAAVASHQALAALITRRSGLLARVADVLAARAEAGAFLADGLPADAVDWRRCGVLGFSLGGAVALDAAARHTRFVQAANMDGLLFRCGDEDTESLLDGLKAAPLFLDQRMPAFAAVATLPDSPCPGRNLNEAVLASERVIRRIIERTGARRLVLDQAGHDDFTDRPFLDPLGMVRHPARRQIHAQICEALTGYFSDH